MRRWLAAIRRGDEEAFARLYAAYQGRSSATRSTCAAPARPTMSLQETFLALLRGGEVRRRVAARLPGISSGSPGTTSSKRLAVARLEDAEGRRPKRSRRRRRTSASPFDDMSRDGSQSRPCERPFSRCRPYTAKSSRCASWRSSITPLLPLSSSVRWDGAVAAASGEGAVERQAGRLTAGRSKELMCRRNMRSRAHCDGGAPCGRRRRREPRGIQRRRGAPAARGAIDRARARRRVAIVTLAAAAVLRHRSSLCHGSAARTTRPPVSSRRHLGFARW